MCTLQPTKTKVWPSKLWPMNDKNEDNKEKPPYAEHASCSKAVRTTALIPQKRGKILGICENLLKTWMSSVLAIRSKT